MTYSEIQEMLFTPHSNYTDSAEGRTNIDADDNASTQISDWDIYFSDKVSHPNIQDLIERIRIFRNRVAHCKFFFKKDYGPGLTGITITAESVIFTGFPEAPDVLTFRAYGQLAYLVLNFASEAKRIPARRSEIFNVKYAFRAWLVALGMNGPAFSESRAALLKDLPGCCNYRTEETRERAMERAREKRGAKKRGKIEFVYTE